MDEERPSRATCDTDQTHAGEAQDTQGVWGADSRALTRVLHRRPLTRGARGIANCYFLPDGRRAAQSWARPSVLRGAFEAICDAMKLPKAPCQVTGRLSWRDKRPTVLSEPRPSSVATRRQLPPVGFPGPAWANAHAAVITVARNIRVTAIAAFFAGADILSTSLMGSRVADQPEGNANDVPPWEGMDLQA